MKVTPEELMAVAKQLESGAGNISDQLGVLKSRVQGLVDGQFEGAASDAFRNLYEQWNTSGAKLNEALMGISRMLHRTGEDFRTTDEELARRFQS